MYVLHHADQPSLYAGLPDAPTISPLVSLWKGVSKPLGLLGMAAVALFGFFHYIRVGRNVVEEDEHGPDPAVHQVDPAVHSYDPRKP
ncbi:formate dehydrogenase, beta subunit [compost metagenome]